MRDSTRMLSALKYPQYRRYWLGNLAAVSGQQMLILAQGWLVYELTESPLYLGYAGLMTALPAILLNLVGGVLADRIDQRKVIVSTQLVMASSIACLATLTALDLVQVWHVLAVAFISGATQAFNNPARQAIFPQLLDRKDLMNAVSLNSIVWQVTRIFAPAIGGVIAGTAGLAVTFYICTGFSLALAFSVAGLKVQQVARQRQASMGRDLVEGLSFIRENFLFAFLIGMSFFNSFFGSASQQLAPIFARDILDVGVSGLGFMFSMSGVGSILGLIALGFIGDYEHKGRLLVAGATGFGATLVLFAVSESYPVSVAAFFLMGAVGSVYMITLQTALQLRVPDELRGRVMGVYGMTYNVGPLGSLQAGAIAAAFGAPAAVALGGILIMSFALVVAVVNREVRDMQTVVAAEGGGPGRVAGWA
ncbi:MAG TPA: MFS transporter [Dehalococcoidia bacterium]|nr:MFS transporter [Dehalococcoidia bacterium]